MNDEQVEQEIQDKGLTAKRVRFEDITAKVAALRFEFWLVPYTTTTVCAAIDPTGFSVALGQSACISPENFDAELGRNVAKDDAIKKATDELWKLEGYRLKNEAA